jgi:hypothetical protein
LWQERIPEIGSPGGAQGPVCQAVVRALEGQNARTACAEERRLEGGFHGLRARTGENGDREVAGCEPGQCLEQGNLDCRGVNIAQGMGQERSLTSNGRGDTRVCVTGHGNTETRCEIDVVVAIDITHDGAARLLPEDRMLGIDVSYVSGLYAAEPRRERR